jgi:hypothetical protein
LGPITGSQPTKAQLVRAPHPQPALTLGPHWPSSYACAWLAQRRWLVGPQGLFDQVDGSTSPRTPDMRARSGSRCVVTPPRPCPTVTWASFVSAFSSTLANPPWAPRTSREIRLNLLGMGWNRGINPTSGTFATGKPKQGWKRSETVFIR